MIPEPHIYSYLNESYVNAIVSSAGYGCEFLRRDYGVDAIITDVQGVKTGGKTAYIPTGVQFSIQMKATHDYIESEDCITYALDADAYNRMLQHNGGLIVLVLFCIPKDSTKRVCQAEESLELRHCCYWCRIAGAKTDNKKSQTIKIPRAQMFSVGACTELMQIAKDRSW